MERNRTKPLISIVVPVYNVSDYLLVGPYGMFEGW